MDNSSLDNEEYWNGFPLQFEETEFLKQIGNTVSGKPITEEQFSASISDIRSGLDISEEDRILDLCCGNGIRTVELSKYCREIVGVDISQYLINIANKYFHGPNISYRCMSVFDKQLLDFFSENFNKILMYGALQNFNLGDLIKLLEQINALSNRGTIIFIGSIPDIEKISDFYNFNDQRKNFHETNKNKLNVLNNWWKKEDLIEICNSQGFNTEILSQNELTDTAYYRFDLRLIITDKC